MTSPSAAHTGHVGPLNEIVAASEDLGLYDLTDADRTAAGIVRPPCPNDTDGDGNCAAWRTCPYCGPDAQLRPRPVVDYGTNANPSPQAMLELALAAVQPLVDAGDASWCPVCGGTGSITYPKLGGRAGTFVNVRRTCARCRGGRLNPFHGCTFTTDDPCACTTRCQAYRPQETPTP